MSDQNENAIVEVPFRVMLSENSVQFHQGMFDRMAVSKAKYGHVTDESVKKFNPLKNLEVRLQKYQETGNTEWLMDAANCCMIEFMFPQHPDAHFRATDSRESPGRSDAKTGAATHEANTSHEENQRRGGTKFTTSGGFYRREGD